MKNVSVTIITPSDSYGCSPCADNGRDVNAEVEVHHTVGVLDMPAITWMCATHAECMAHRNGVGDRRLLVA